MTFCSLIFLSLARFGYKKGEKYEIKLVNKIMKAENRYNVPVISFQNKIK